MYYNRHQKRGAISHAHIWYGRALMLMGIVNGGLGLRLHDADSRWIVAYSILSVILGLVYIGAIVFRLRRGVKSSPSQDKLPLQDYPENPPTVYTK